MYFPTSEQTSMQPEWQISLPSEPGHESTSASFSFSFFFPLLPFFFFFFSPPPYSWKVHLYRKSSNNSSSNISRIQKIWRVTSSTPSFFRLSLINLSHFDRLELHDIYYHSFVFYLRIRVRCWSTCTNRSSPSFEKRREKRKRVLHYRKTKICLRYEETELEFIANRTFSQECVT